MDIGDKMFNVMKDICNTLKEMSKQMSNIEDHLAKKNSGFSTDNSTEDKSTRKRKRENQEEQKKKKSCDKDKPSCSYSHNFLSHNVDNTRITKAIVEKERGRNENTRKEPRG